MVNVDLKAKHRWALLVLMAMGGEATNPDLKQAVGFSLVGEDRRLLNDLQLVASTPPKPYITHELTEAGWQWCAEELSGGQPPDDAKPAGRALYVVLQLVQRYLTGIELTLLDFCQTAMNGGSADTLASAPVDLSGQIFQSYQQLSSKPGQWVSLTDLRSLMRSQVDDTLRELNRGPAVHIVPESNQKSLSERDREAAVHIGGADSHLISIDAL